MHRDRTRPCRTARHRCRARSRRPGREGSTGPSTPARAHEGEEHDRAGPAPEALRILGERAHLSPGPAHGSRRTRRPSRATATARARRSRGRPKGAARRARRRRRPTSARGSGTGRCLRRAAAAQTRPKSATESTCADDPKRAEDEAGRTRSRRAHGRRSLRPEQRSLPERPEQDERDDEDDASRPSRRATSGSGGPGPTRSRGRRGRVITADT